MYLLYSPVVHAVIFSVTAVVLLCGSVGLLMISWKSPTLRGLGWVSGSFALGGASAFLLGILPAAARSFTGLAAGLSSLAMLACFSLLDRSAREMVSEGASLSRTSRLLLALQIAVSLAQSFLPGHSEWERLGSDLLLCTQGVATGLMLLRRRRETARVPALLCAFLLWAYMGVVAIRAFTGFRAHSWNQSLFAAMHVGFSMLLLAIILGIAFGLFWMSTSVFANGLEHIASTDPLTRIFNRRTFLLWCEKETNRSLGSELSFSLLMLDLDHFKQVNDCFGHSIGDRLLCSVVERIQDGVRGIDVLGRWGGEEFVVLLPRASAEAAFLVAERVRRNIERSSIGLSEFEARGHARLLQVTASLGTATFGGVTDTTSAMFERADAALYAAKKQGRNCTVSSENRGPASRPEASVPLLEPAPPSSPELVV